MKIELVILGSLFILASTFVGEVNAKNILLGFLILIFNIIMFIMK